MKLAWLSKLPPQWRARALRWGYNRHPAFRGTGGKVVHVGPDLRHIRIALALSRRTRNLVGSIYGGSLFGITDGPYPLMLMAVLGDGYVVWDKSAKIRFRKPGLHTLWADFVLGEAELAEIRRELAQQPELDHTFWVELKDAQGTVHTVVERTVYIAEKHYYLQKRKGPHR